MATNMLKLTMRTDQPHLELPLPQIVGQEFEVVPVGDEPCRVFSGGKQILEIPAGYYATLQVKRPRWWQFWRSSSPYWAMIEEG